MGLIRGALIVLISVILFVSLLATGFFATLTSSLTYQNVEPQVHSIATEIIEEQIGKITIIDTLTPYLDEYCDNNSEIVQKFQRYTFVFPCEVIANGTDSIINYSVDYLVGDFYYKNYQCEFWKCFEESDVPLFLVSDYARDYWRARFYNTLLISFVLAAGLILLSRKKSNGFILAGSLLIISSLIILQLKRIGTFVAKLVLSPISIAISEETSQSILSQVVEIFFSKSGTIFIWMFVIALILVGIGIVFKLFNLGFKISEFFKKVGAKNIKVEKPKKK